jgi:phospholipid/cholesterol/gamma-HCH transport system substrate-binding protein
VKRLFSPVGRFFGRRSKAQLGVLFLVAIGLCSLALFNKSRLLVNVKGGERLSAEFASNYKLREYTSQVKVAGVKIGTVTSVSETPAGTVRVDMRVTPGIRAKLGKAPSASIRPTTLLGGAGLSVYVDLRPGGASGRFAGTIPAERTTIPVEFDRVLEVFTDTSRAGLSAAVAAFDEGFAGGGGTALGSVVDQAPGTLPAATEVLAGLGGEHPGDLAALVRHLGSVAASLTESDAEIESVLRGGATASQTLGDRAGDVEALLGSLPKNLTEARRGLDALSGTLAGLETTAPAARPAVQRLAALLAAARPVLAEARPLLADVRPLLADLDPLLRRLAPTVSLADTVLDDLDGPVIGRIRDPILTAFNSPYGGSSSLLHQEFAYFIAGLDGVLKYTDRGGAAINYHGGVNEDTLSGGRPAGTPGPAVRPAAEGRRAR